MLNNNLEKLETLTLISDMLKEHPKTKIQIGDLRKYAQILVTNSYSMTLEELEKSFTLLIGISRTDEQNFQELSKFLTSYLHNYAFQEHSQLVSHEYQILSKTLAERNKLQQKSSADLSSGKSLESMSQESIRIQILEEAKRKLVQRKAVDLFELEEELNLSKISPELFTSLKVSLQHLNSVLVMLVASSNGVQFSENTIGSGLKSLGQTLGKGQFLTQEHLDVLHRILALALEQNLDARHSALTEQLKLVV